MPRLCHKQPQSNPQIQLLTPLACASSPSSPRQLREEPSLSSKSGLECQKFRRRTHPDSPPLNIQTSPRSVAPSLSCTPDCHLSFETTARAPLAAPDAAVCQTGLAHNGPEGWQILPLSPPFTLSSLPSSSACSSDPLPPTETQHGHTYTHNHTCTH